MSTLTVTAKGQVTLRRELLDHLGVRPGDRIDVDKLPDGRITVRAAERSGRLADLAGCLRREGQPQLSIDEINAVIARGWAGQR
jgi:antitoxin PrlF